MKILGRVATGALIVLAAACSRSPGQRPILSHPEPPDRASSLFPFNLHKLAYAVSVNEQDLPIGWSKVAATASDLSPPASDEAPLWSCLNMANNPEQAGVVMTNGPSYTSATGHEGVSSTVQQVPSSAVATELMTALGGSKAGSCDQARGQTLFQSLARSTGDSLESSASESIKASVNGLIGFHDTGVFRTSAPVYVDVYWYAIGRQVIDVSFESVGQPFEPDLERKLVTRIVALAQQNLHS